MNVDEIKFLRSCAGNEDSFQKLLQYAKKQNRYRYLSDAIANGVVITQNGVIVDANMATTRIFGYDYDEIPNRHVMDFEAPDSIQKIPYEIRDNLDTPYEITAVHKDGHIFPAEIEGRNVEYDGELYRVIVIRDITVRKSIETELEESKAYKTAILESTSDSIWTLDSNRCLVTFNSAFEDRLQRSFGIQIAKGMQLAELLPEERFRHAQLFYERAFAGEKVVYESDYSYNNLSICVEIALNPILKGDVVVGVAGFGRDITERKRNEKALMQTQANMLALVENTNGAIWSVDRDLRLITFNSTIAKSYFKTYGILLSVGMHLSEMLPKEAYESIKIHYERTLQGSKEKFEYAFQSGDQTFYREISLGPITIRDRVAGVVAFGADITERKLSEMALRESQANLTSIIENNSDLIWSIDVKYKLIAFNSNFKRFFYNLYGVNVTPGMYPFNAESPHDMEKWPTRYNRALKGEKYCLEIEYSIKNEKRCAEIWLNPTFTNGIITGAVAFSRDITERKRNESALKTSEANVTALIENTTDHFWSIDREYRLLVFNSVFSKELHKNFGVSIRRGDLLAKILPPQADIWLPLYERCFTGEHVVFEYENRFASEIMYSEISLHPIITDGSVTGAACFSRDITSQKRNEIALKTSQANIAALIENTADSYWSVDREYRLITLNSVYSNVFLSEYDIRLQTGDVPHKFLPQETALHWIGLYDRCFAGESINFDFEFAINSELRDYNISLHPIITDGVITGAACVSRDITERKKSEERNRQHAALLDIANEAIIVRDLDTTVLFWNKAAEKMYGWVAGEVIGRSMTELLYDKENIHTFKQAWDELLFSGHWSGELTHHSRSGKEIIVYCRWTLVFDPDGKPASVLSLHSDITEQKSLQQQFYRSQRLESLGTLASGIAHDLNNVLTPILLTVEILRLKYPEEKNSKILETIEVSAKRGADIVKQVLLFSKGSGGERIPLSLAESISEIEMIIQKTFSKSIELHVNISDNVQPVLGDSTQIQQILMNLCVNARDAMPDGGTLRIELDSKSPTNEVFKTTPEARSMEYSVLTITDSGTGIPQELLEWIFDPFFTTKEPGSGTGLGLSTVNAIVKSHNGFIRVYSKENEGTSFEIWLPAFKEIEFKQALPDSIEVVLSGLGKTILIVDDEPLLLQIITFTLQKFNFTILTASNGQEALLVYNNHPEIELVITDINMPGMDGPTLIAELILINPSLKFIVMTGLPINNRMDQMKTIGVSSFLSKPFQTQVLLNAIENAFKADVENV